jgi:hypothetical protein
MADSGCANCSLRKKYDDKPKSLLGRFWRWHVNWCPGWKDYMSKLDDGEKQKHIEKYNLKQ